jgi:hypothetical protein
MTGLGAPFTLVEVIVGVTDLAESKTGETVALSRKPQRNKKRLSR